MPCRQFVTADGHVGFACSRGQRQPELLCDWPLTGAKAGKTCDREAPHHIGPDTDLCGAHFRLWQRVGWPGEAVANAK